LGRRSEGKEKERRGEKGKIMGDENVRRGRKWG